MSNIQRHTHVHNYSQVHTAQNIIMRTIIQSIQNVNNNEVTFSSCHPMISLAEVYIILQLWRFNSDQNHAKFPEKSSANTWDCTILDIAKC